MKNLQKISVVFSLGFVLAVLPVLSFAWRIDGPSRVCPGETVTYKFRSGFYDVLNCSIVAWAIIQNGNTVATAQGINLSIVWPNTNPGNVTVRAEGFLCCGILEPFCDSDVNKTVTVGLSTPTSVLGAQYICPDGNESYSVSSVPNAVSYTWEVPNNTWKVNGIVGPIVSGQGRLVSLTAPSYGSGNKSIKVRASSPTCGSSATKTKTIRLDYPNPTIVEDPISNSYTEFNASPLGASSYQWTLPNSWDIDAGQGTPQIEAFTYGNPGTLRVDAAYPCGVKSGFFYYDIGSTLARVFPNPTSDFISFKKDSKISNVRLMDNRNTIIKQWEDLEKAKNRLDISGLESGTYILKYIAGKKEEEQRVIIKD